MLSTFQPMRRMKLASLVCVVSLTIPISASCLSILLCCRYYSPELYLTVISAICASFLILNASAMLLDLIIPNSRILVALNFSLTIGTFASGSIWLCKLIEHRFSWAAHNSQSKAVLVNIEQAVFVLWVASLMVHMSYCTNGARSLYEKHTSQRALPNSINQKVSIPYSMGSLRTLDVSESMAIGGVPDLENCPYIPDPSVETPKHSMEHSTVENSLVESVRGLAISSPRRVASKAAQCHNSSTSYDSIVSSSAKKPPIRFSSVQCLGGLRTSTVDTINSHAHTFSSQSIVIDTTSTTQLPISASNMGPPPSPTTANKSPHHIKYWKSTSFGHGLNSSNTKTDSWPSKSVRKHKSTSSIFSFLPNSSSSLIQNLKSPKKSSAESSNDDAGGNGLTISSFSADSRDHKSSGSATSGSVKYSPYSPSEGSFDFSDIVHTHEAIKHSKSSGVLDIAHAAFDTWDVHSQEIKDRYLWSAQDDESQRDVSGSSISTNGNSFNRISSAGFTKEAPVTTPIIGYSDLHLTLPKRHERESERSERERKREKERNISIASTPILDTTDEDIYGTVSQYDKERLTNF